MAKQLVQNVLRTFGYELNKVRKYNQSGERWACWPMPTAIAQTCFEIDERFHRLYNLAQEKTQMVSMDNPLRRQRHYTLNHILWSFPHLAEGNICELGCRSGLSAYQISDFIKKQNLKVKFHIFDSFEGLSELEQVDIAQDRTQNLEILRKDYACPLDTVKENLKEFNFIEYHKGWIPTRFPDVADKKFSFVHIDVDLFQPTFDSLEFFYPRLVKGGIVVFDDYGSMQFPGAKQAVDKYLEKAKDAFFVPLPSGQAFLVRGL